MHFELFIKSTVVVFGGEAKILHLFTSIIVEVSIKVLYLKVDCLLRFIIKNYRVTFSFLSFEINFNFILNKILGDLKFWLICFKEIICLIKIKIIVKCTNFYTKIWSYSRYESMRNNFSSELKFIYCRCLWK